MSVGPEVQHWAGVDSGAVSHCVGSARCRPLDSLNDNQISCNLSCLLPEHLNSQRNITKVVAILAPSPLSLSLSLYLNVS